MKLSSKKGFSLVELIIVIAILGIIAVIAVPNLTNIQQNAQKNADIRTAEAIGKAVRIWLTDGTYDTTESRKDEISTDAKEYSTLSDIENYIAGGKVAKGHEDGAYNVKLNGNYVEVYIDSELKYSEGSGEQVYQGESGTETPTTTPTP